MIHDQADGLRLLVKQASQGPSITVSAAALWSPLSESAVRSVAESMIAALSRSGVPARIAETWICDSKSPVKLGRSHRAATSPDGPAVDRSRAECGSSVPNPLVLIDLRKLPEARHRMVWRQSPRAIVITSGDPDAITDTYVFLKSNSQSEMQRPRVGLIVVAANDSIPGTGVAVRLQRSCERFFDLRVDYLGDVRPQGMGAGATGVRAAAWLLDSHSGSASMAASARPLEIA
jgi:hypothetical protein